MHSNLNKLNFIKDKVRDIINKKQLKTEPKIIAVTKTFSFDKIIPLLEQGHVHFGENKIQEAEKKWKSNNNKYQNYKLHMIGGLQSNKAKKAVQIFDYIHSLDNEKLASKLNFFENELSKKNKLFIQVNLADEIQKSGISLKHLNNFYNYCTKDLSLNVIGLMCLPPTDSNPEKYFKLLKLASENLNLSDLSMGMSADYEKAIIEGSTYIRLGTAILGQRTVK